MLTPVRQLGHHWLPGSTQRKSVRPTGTLILSITSTIAVPLQSKGTEADLLALLENFHASPNLSQNKHRELCVSLWNPLCPRNRLPKVDRNKTSMGKQLTPPDSALPSESLCSNKSTKHCTCNPVATASFQHFIMLTVHNLHQSLFGNRPSTASHGSGRHDH